MSGVNTYDPQPLPDALVPSASALRFTAFSDDSVHQVTYPHGQSEESLEKDKQLLRDELRTGASPGNLKIWHQVIVDPDAPDRVLCYSLWLLRETPPEGDDESNSSFTAPADSNVEAFNTMRAARQAIRSRVLKEMGNPNHLFLAVLVTAPEARRKGCGSRLLRWGQRLASDLNVPCVLQASPAGLPLYKKLGWEVRGEIKQDLTQWDLSRGTAVETVLVWQPPRDGA